MSISSRPWTPDYYVRRYEAKKGGRRVPEDRLRSCVWSMGLVIPACLLVYGWTVQFEVGGLAVPLVAMFVQGFFQMFCVPSINTYCIDVLQPEGRSAEAVSCNYLLRYAAAAVASGVVLPIAEAIGLGWFCVITSALLAVSTVGIVACIRWGERWRESRKQTSEAAETE